MDNWVNEWAEALEPEKPLKKPYTVYAIEFSDNSVYVGISSNIKERMRHHQFGSESSAVKSVYEKIHSIDYKIITGKQANFFRELSMENELIDQYRSSGWTVLNIRKGRKVS
jgi:predicted GIY-YIG superfamily endonuclease